MRKLSCEDFHRNCGKRLPRSPASKKRSVIRGRSPRGPGSGRWKTALRRIQSQPARTTSKLACRQKAVSGWYATSAITEARQDCVSARKSDVSRRNATQSQVPSAGVTPLRGSPPGTSQRVKPCTLVRISSSTYSTKTLGRARISEHDRHALGVARPRDRGSDHVPGVA